MNLLRCSLFATPVLVLALALEPVMAVAADTIEVWDRGAYNAELHVGAAGFHSGSAEREVTNDFLFGRGLTSRLSAYAGGRLTPSKGPQAATWDLCMGFIGSLVETHHVDVDFVLDASVGGEGWDTYGLVPAFEINLDREPDLAAWGLYIRASAPFWREPVEDPASAREWSRGFDLGLNPGAYWTVSDRHQVLVEYEVAFEISRKEPGAVDRGCFAIGLNAVVDERFEVVTHVRVTVPDAGDSPATSFGIGLIGTLARVP